MSQAKIRNLLSFELADSTVGRRLRISYDNVQLVPAAAPNETHLQTHLIPIPTYSDSLGGDIITYTGLYQIKIMIGSGKSTAEADNIADELFRLFRVNRVITDTDTGFKTQVISPFVVGEGRRIDGWWSVPCHFEYRTDTN